MIEIVNLTKNYGEKVAVDNISFKINHGEIVGFLGPNGAGKSTTMNIITGYISPSSGKVLVNGFDILDNPDQVKKSIGYLPEQPPLYLDMTVVEYLKFVAELKGVKKSDIEGEIARVKKIVKIEDVSNRLIKNLSKGYKQRVGIAQAILSNAEVLILDEPTVGLDPKQIIEIRDLILELGKTHTVILSSHILSEIQAVCNRVIIINNGRIVADENLHKLESSIENSKRISLIVEGPSNEILAELKHIQDVIDCNLVDANRNKFELIVNEKFLVRNIFYTLANKRWPIIELVSKETNLEELFINLVSGEN